MSKKIILLKLTGTIFSEGRTHAFTRSFADTLAEQIEQLSATHHFGIVVGGGDFFRGAESNGSLKLRPSIAHSVGMFGTIMNGIMLYDIFRSHNIATKVLCALPCAAAGTYASQEAIDEALSNNKTIIFSGGTANPYVSTDTGAIMRALQINAMQVWKASSVDGVFSCDPHKDHSACKIPIISYQEVLDRQLTFIDQTAIILARQHHMPIRVFDIFKPKALINAAADDSIGSIIQEKSS